VRRELNAVSRFEFADLVFGEPDRNLDRDRARVIRKHEILQRLVPQLVVADSGERRGTMRRLGRWLPAGRGRGAARSLVEKEGLGFWVAVRLKGEGRRDVWAVSWYWLRGLEW
jgi:hypothetical protein